MSASTSVLEHVQLTVEHATVAVLAHVRNMASVRTEQKQIFLLVELNADEVQVIRLDCGGHVSGTSDATRSAMTMLADELRAHTVLVVAHEDDALHVDVQRRDAGAGLRYSSRRDGSSGCFDAFELSVSPCPFQIVPGGDLG